MNARMTARERMVREQAVGASGGTPSPPPSPSNHRGRGGYWRRPASGLAHKGKPGKTFEKGYDNCCRSRFRSGLGVGCPYGLQGRGGLTTGGRGGVFK